MHSKNSTQSSQQVTETEQIFEEMTSEEKTDHEDKDNEDVEQSDEKNDDKSEEEAFSEEELEIEREIDNYANKIEKLDARLDELKSEKLDRLKAEQMKKRGYSNKHVERYKDHVKGEAEDEIKRSVMQMMIDIPPVDNSTDPSAMNYARPKHKSKLDQAEEVGKRVADRVLPKIFPGLRK